MAIFAYFQYIKYVYLVGGGGPKSLKMCLPKLEVLSVKICLQFCNFQTYLQVFSEVHNDF